ncbi:MAG: DUF2723 domain-containing protein [Actinomycetota bacterium]
MTVLDSPREAERASSRRRDVAIVAVVTLVARLATRAGHPTEWDSANLTLGVGGFDVVERTPHAPGYWLYVRLGALADVLTPLDAHDSLVLVAAITSAAGAAIAFVVLADLVPRPVALAGAALVATNPIAWFYGSIAATYGFDALAAVALVWLVVRARPGGTELMWAAVVVGLSSGFRPSIAVLYAPAVLLIAARCVRTPAHLIRPIAAGAAATSVWLIPLALEQPGGLGAWLETTQDIWSDASRVTSTLEGGPEAAANRRNTFVQSVLVVSAAIPIVGLWVAGRLAGGGAAPDPRRRLAAFGIAAVALPPLLVAGLVHFPKAGYLLSYSPVLLLGAALAVGSLVGHWQRLGVVALGLAAFVQAALFLSTDALLPARLEGVVPSPFDDTAAGAPYAYTWAEIRRVDREGDAFARLADELEPGRDVVLFAADNGGYRFRQATALIRDVPVYYALTTIVAEPRVDTISIDGALFELAEGRFDAPADRVEVPDGGRVVVVLDVPTGRLPDREAAGSATRRPLADPPPALDFVDPGIWVLDPTGDPLELWR